MNPGDEEAVALPDEGAGDGARSGGADAAQEEVAEPAGQAEVEPG
ncbi:MAG: hypothetical protein ACE149_07770 [Armatimonadota bacterium]